MTHATSGKADELCEFSMTRILIENYNVFYAGMMQDIVLRMQDMMLRMQDMMLRMQDMMLEWMIKRYLKSTARL